MRSALPAPICTMCLALLTVCAAAQAQSVESRVVQVKVYPGSATVERVARVAAGSRTLTFNCLPAGLDVQSLQVVADGAVRVGETSVLTQPRALAPRCSVSPLDGRIRQLEEQKDALQAETDALGIVTGYLKGLSSGGDDASGKRAAVDSKTLAASTDALHRSGQDALLKQRQIARRLTELDHELDPLVAERSRSLGGAAGQVVAVTVTLNAPSDADVHLSYQINGPGWTPAYRAQLDTTTRRLRIERQALVAQATGEDWRGVKLLLSTGQPRRETTGRVPAPWRIGIEPPPVARDDRMRELAMAAPPPSAPAMVASARLAQVPDAPVLDTSVFNNSFATEFSVPQAIDVPSGNQRVAVLLGQHEDTAKMAVRTSPRLDPSAFLVAEIAQPAGVWPAGTLQLYRDGAFVGNGRWAASAEPRLTLSFGRDELVRVEAEPEHDNQGSGGFIGSRAERRVQRAYVVENRHATPVAVQVLEAAPVSVDDQVRVTTQFVPQPTELAWNKQPGVVLWSFDLDAGKSARVTADYTIGYPKDARLQER